MLVIKHIPVLGNNTNKDKAIEKLPKLKSNDKSEILTIDPEKSMPSDKWTQEFWNIIRQALI